MTVRTLAAGGDSQTDYSFGVARPSDTWVPVLGDMLNAALAAQGSGTVRARGFGFSGDTSTLVLARADGLQLFDVPDIAGIAIGVNDPGASIASATTTLNVGATIMALKFGATGQGAGLGGACSVAGQANLPAYGHLGQRYVVLSDTSTTGGVAAFLASHKATIAGTVAADVNGNKLAVWEFRYNQAGERGWARVAVSGTTPWGTRRFFVVDPPYRNFTTGGDSPSTPVAGNLAVRTALQAAVTAQNVTTSGTPSVIYVDLYAFLRSRILAGTDPNFSADTALVASTAYDQTRSWHYVDANQHYNAYGHGLQAQAVLAAITAQAPTWITELAA